MHILILTGGDLDRVFARSYIQTQKFDKVIAADKGLFYAEQIGIRPDFILGGNVRSITLQNGTPEEVYAECAAILKKMKYFPRGFVLTPECTISYLTPPANFYAMLKAARELGAYDPSESPN